MDDEFLLNGDISSQKLSGKENDKANTEVKSWFELLIYDIEQILKETSDDIRWLFGSSSETIIEGLKDISSSKDVSEAKKNSISDVDDNIGGLSLESLDDDIKDLLDSESTIEAIESLQKFVKTYRKDDPFDEDNNGGSSLDLKLNKILEDAYLFINSDEVSDLLDPEGSEINFAAAGKLNNILQELNALFINSSPRGSIDIDSSDKDGGLGRMLQDESYDIWW